MAKAQPRGEFGIDVTMKNKRGHKQGTLVITSGGIDYYPRHARIAAASFSLKKVAELMVEAEKKEAYQ